MAAIFAQQTFDLPNPPRPIPKEPKDTKIVDKGQNFAKGDDSDESEYYDTIGTSGEGEDPDSEALERSVYYTGYSSTNHVLHTVKRRTLYAQHGLQELRRHFPDPDTPDNRIDVDVLGLGSSNAID